MQAYVFPGQGSQFEGMGSELYKRSKIARDHFRDADDILGFPLSKLMLEGSAEKLTETEVAQPAILVHSLIAMKTSIDTQEPEVVAGHSLGEITALVAADVLSFEQGLRLVSARAAAMQKACEAVEGTMVAVVGFDDEITERICEDIVDVVVPANYNTDGQLVISGSVKGVDKAVDALREAGARILIKLPVSGGFHSPLMREAQNDFATVVEEFTFKDPLCPIYQNVSARPEIDAELIKANIVKQITSPVFWKQSMQNMLADGVSAFVEVGGKGNVLKGFIKKIDRKVPVACLN